MKSVKIIPAETRHFEDIFLIFQEVITTGDSYVYSAAITPEEFYEIWIKQPYVYVAVINGKVVGSYMLRPNFPGRGAHIANCGYIVNQQFRGQNIGRKMGEHSLKVAKEQKFLAMQFNMVVSTNHVAVKLWQSLGFKIIGTVPQAFNHQQLGLVDGFIMHRML